MPTPSYDAEQRAKEVADRAEQAQWDEAVMTSDTLRQQAVDARFKAIDESIGALRFELANNSEVTKDIREILTSFKVMGKAAKWLTAVGAFLGMLYAWAHGYQK